MITERGPAIGQLRGKPIPSFIVDDGGRRYEFARFGRLSRGGQFDMAQLKFNECVIAPGLVYVAKVAPNSAA